MTPNNDVKSHWEGVDDVEILRLAPGEAGATAREYLTHFRLEAIAEWFATPETERTPKGLVELARAIGASPGSIRRWQRDPRMLRRVQQKTIEFLTYMVPNVLWAQYQQAMERRDPRAAQIVLAAGGVGSGSGRAPVTVNTEVHVSQQVSVDQDEIVLAEVNEFVERRVRGRLAAIQAQPGPTTPVSGHQEKQTVEAIFAHPSNPPVPQLPSPDPSPGGTEPGR